MTPSRLLSSSMSLPLSTTSTSLFLVVVMVDPRLELRGTLSLWWNVVVANNATCTRALVTLALVLILGLRKELIQIQVLEEEIVRPHLLGGQPTLEEVFPDVVQPKIEIETPVTVMVIRGELLIAKPADAMGWQLVCKMFSNDMVFPEASLVKRKCFVAWTKLCKLAWEFTVCVVWRVRDGVVIEHRGYRCRGRWRR